MNKIFTFITMLIAMLTVSIAIPLHAEETTTPTWVGGGTSDSPYEISSKEHLQAITTQGLDKHYKLTAYIDLTGDWTPIKDFTGTFDGGGYIIKGLNVSVENHAGLFETIGKSGTVQNLGVIGSVTSTNGIAGGITGDNKGMIQNCYTNVTVETKASASAGGIAGINYRMIQNCYTTGAVTSGSKAGGIAGVNGDESNTATIQYCYATGVITGNYAGGITGEISTGSNNCIALNNNIIGIGDAPQVGRITGCITSGSLSNNHAVLSIPGAWKDKGANDKDGADLTNDNFIGKGANEGAFASWEATAWEFGDNTNLPTLKGFKTDQPIKDMARAPFLVVPVTTITTQEELVAIKDNLSGSYKLGGNITLTGEWTPLGDDSEKFTGTLDGCGFTINGLNVSIIENSMTYGGLFGNIDKNGTVKNLGVTGSVTVTTTDNPYANAHAGGIAGQSNGKIMNCYTNVTVNATSDAYIYAGGIVGYMANTAATISNCFAIGNCTATGTNSAIAGGILGGNNGKGSISYCFATGTVEAKGATSSKYAGGIAGQSGTTMTGCIALNKGITGASDYTNRIAGNHYASTITNCYASPAIPGTWNESEIGATKKNGADLTDDNFIDKGAEQGAFIGWSSDNWDFGDNANLPKLKTTGLTSNIVIKGQDAAMPTRTNFLEGSIEISASVTYDAETHKDKNIIVKSGGAFTIATSEASLKKLTIEDGGEVVASNTFTCKELLAPRTLSNQWTAYGSPVEMKAVAGTSQTFYNLSGYTDTQAWGTTENTTATSYDISKLNLIATEAAGVPVTLTAPMSGSDPVSIPADKDQEATIGKDLNTGIFLFCANPTLKTVTIPVAYILSEDGTRFEQKKDAVVKPFQSYIVANAVTSAAVMSLRAGEVPTANEPVALPDDSFRLWGTDGQLHLSTDRPTDIEVYNLSGQPLRRFTLNGSRTLTLPHGIYLVRSNNITYKVSLL